MIAYYLSYYSETLLLLILLFLSFILKPKRGELLVLFRVMITLTVLEMLVSFIGKIGNTYPYFANIFHYLRSFQILIYYIFPVLSISIIFKLYKIDIPKKAISIIIYFLLTLGIILFSLYALSGYLPKGSITFRSAILRKLVYISPFFVGTSVFYIIYKTRSVSKRAIDKFLIYIFPVNWIILTISVVALWMFAEFGTEISSVKKFNLLITDFISLIFFSIFFFKIFFESKSQRIDSATLNKIYKKINEYLDDDYNLSNQNLKIVTLTKEFKHSSNSINLACKEKTGLTFTQLLVKKRINYAKRILRDESYNNITFEAIGMMSGFKTRETFSRKFKEIEGLTLKEFKQNTGSKAKFISS